MAQTSRQVRKLRRLKRELTLAYRGLDLAVSQRDQARMVAGALEHELKKYTDDPFPEDSPTNESPSPAVTITKIEDEETEGVNLSE